METQTRGELRKRWTRAEYHQMADCGVLTGKYELIEGEIWEKMPQNPPHINTLELLAERLIALFGYDFVRMQAPVMLEIEGSADNEPEPDIVVRSRPRSAFLDRHPGAEDLLLVVEISDATRRYDLTGKALLYSRAGIVEYWVVDLEKRRVVVHRDPQPEGYIQIGEFSSEATIATLAKPESPISLSEIFPTV